MYGRYNGIGIFTKFPLVIPSTGRMIVVRMQVNVMGSD
jgi:hypothetical protein